MAQRRSHSTKDTPKEPQSHTEDHKHGNGRVEHDNHDHDEHSHSHSHSIFGHSHSHGEEHTHDAEQIIAALQGSGDRGSYITLVGLFSNIGLTAVKGLAGWYMHSASLLADAGHSMSDLLGDFVTLFCWRLSRKPPSERYPYGFAKFETLGTTTISLLLIGGALGIGFHSYHLLITTLAETAVTLPPGPLQDILTNITSTATLPTIGHGHGHGHVHSVDPNAAWFAAISVLMKEWLYRVTKTVADEEKSPVLLANAIHHRSDAYSSLVAFFAILGTWFFPAFPLDPIGGLLVSFVILRQGFGLLAGAWGDLTDASVNPRTRRSLQKALQPLVATSSATQAADATSFSPSLLAIRNLRARHAGSMIFVDLTAEVDGALTVVQASSLERKIEQTLRKARKEIAEVRVSFRAAEKVQ
ncbi:CDF-like metal transporter [Agrocybe pediades]|nr:CDF-like metal transporter [Agrocybe pediades]